MQQDTIAERSGESVRRMSVSAKLNSSSAICAPKSTNVPSSSTNCAPKSADVRRFGPDVPRFRRISRDADHDEASLVRFGPN